MMMFTAALGGWGRRSRGSESGGQAMRKRTWSGVVCGSAAAVAVLLMLPLVMGAKQAEGAMAGEADGSMMCKMMMEKMETMAKLKSLLEEAKGAAEAQGAKTAVEKISAALALIEQEHKAMHDKMAEHMKTMMEKMNSETDAAKKAEMEKKMKEMKEMKCPMCAKMMGEMK
jgi:membrane-bound lytic murein transglycosylase